MMNNNPVGGHAAGTSVSGWILLQTVRILQAASNNNYLSWEGLDVNSVKVWGTYFGPKGGVLPVFQIGQIISVEGTIGQGKQGLAVWATSMVLVQDELGIAEFEALCYPSVPKEQLEQYIVDLGGYSQCISDVNLLQLSIKLFEYFRPYLYTIPAGKAVHEPYRGGLAQHTWEVTGMCAKAMEVKKGLNKDILIFSALYHDIGKTQEYTAQLTWSPNGRLITHSSIVIQLMTDIILTHNIDIEPNLFRQVKHCMLSHHGEHSEIRPATREAMILHYADIMCCKVGHIEEMIRSGNIGGDGWGKYSNIINQAPYVPELDDRITCDKIQ